MKICGNERDGWLFIWLSLNEWSQLETKQEMPLAKKDARTFVRFFYSLQQNVRLISKVVSIFRRIYEHMPV